MPWQTLNTPVDVRITFICFSTIHVDSFFRTDLGLKYTFNSESDILASFKYKYFIVNQDAPKDSKIIINLLQ